MKTLSLEKEIIEGLTSHQIKEYLKQSDDYIKISGIVKESTVDGPGFRYVVFTQGCPHKCEGCHNEHTHNIEGGYYINTLEIIEEIKKNPLLRGVTISGGEPFLQAKKIAKLISKIDRVKHDVIVYTGFEFEKLIKLSNEENNFIELISQVDVIMDGKFILELKSNDTLFRGSSNQRAIDVKRTLNENKVIEYEF